eukprot:maker-scaffold84_size396325-snap-gene-0.15 protein:Tk09669 transcript:maker-scaffold84_size396325-snap-gene-0.15-mRNA-1 annotation:"rna-binding protein lark isoform x9"
MKIYVGNLGDDDLISSEDLKPVFEEYGPVSECEKIKNYAFVHMSDEESGTRAVNDLNNSEVKGRFIRVEKSESRGPRNPSHKIFVGNVKEGTPNAEIRALFEPMAQVIEADVIKNYAFVHLDAVMPTDKVMDIIRQLDGQELHGNNLRVQMSVSDVRTKPGMDSQECCYRCGGRGHFSRECPGGFERLDKFGRVMPRRGAGDDRRGRRDRRDPYPSGGRRESREPFEADAYARDQWASPGGAAAPRPEPFQRRDPYDDYYAPAPRHPDPFQRDPYASAAPRDPYGRFPPAAYPARDPAGMGEPNRFADDVTPFAAPAAYGVAPGLNPGFTSSSAPVMPVTTPMYGRGPSYPAANYR